jgi:hypothetical protein
MQSQRSAGQYWALARASQERRRAAGSSFIMVTWAEGGQGTVLSRRAAVTSELVEAQASEWWPELTVNHLVPGFTE